MTTPAHDMPKGIVTKISAIKKALSPAAQSQHDQDEGRQFSYSTADDIFAAVQKHMAEHQVIVELLDAGLEILQMPNPAGAGADVGAVHMKFAVVISTPEDNYASPRNVVHMIGQWEGMKTCAALRTMAEKTYLRSLLKLPTAAGERPVDAGADDGINQDRPSPYDPHAPYDPRGNAYSQDPGDDDADQTGTRRKPRNPLMLGKAESLDKCAAILAEVRQAAATEDPDPAKVVAAIDTAWKRNASAWARLAPKDQSAVKTEVTKLMSAAALGKQAAA